MNGEGEASATPDTAQITLGVTKTADTVQDAQNQVNQIANQITADVKSLGVTDNDIKTENYTVSPQVDFSSPAQKPTGYTVSEDVVVKVKPIEKANQVIDNATGDGANIVDGTQFVFDDQTQNELENKARSQAIENAKEKAQNIARESGITLGRLVNVQENNQSPIKPLPLAVGLAKPDIANVTPTQLNPGQNTVNSTVTLFYETL